MGYFIPYRLPLSKLLQGGSCLLSMAGTNLRSINMSSSLTKALFLAAASLLSFEASAWRLDLNFNDGAVGAKAQSSGAFNDAAGGTYYTSAVSYEGGKAAELNITAGSTAFGTWGGIITHPTNLKKGDQVWFRVRTFMPAGFNYDSTSEGNRLKFLRIHTRTSSTSNLGYDDWYINPKGASVPFSFIYEGEQVWENFGTSADKPVLGVWETYEMYVKFDNVPASAGGQARVRVWKNGVLMKDITNRKTLASADAYADRTHLFTYWNGGAPQTQKMYVDDIVLTSDTPAAKDAAGNPFVGVGSGQEKPQQAPPMAPVLKIN